MAIGEEAIGDMLGEFAVAALDPSAWLPAMTRFADAIGATSCALELADLNSGRAVMENTLPLEEAHLRHYEERIFHINPRVRRALGMRVGQIADDGELMHADDPDTPEFLDWLERTPYYYILGGKLLNEGGHVGFFTANYARRHGPASAEHHALFRLLTPHLINIVAAGRALSANRLRNERLALDAFEGERPFALIDGAGQVIEHSAGFAAIVQRGGVLGLREARLVALAPQHRAPLARLLGGAIDPARRLEPPLPVRLSGPAAPRGLVLHAVPLAPHGDLFDVFRPAALLTVTDLDQPDRVRRSALAALFGLTEREAEIAALVSEGCSVEQTAQRLVISGYTVRQHLKAVFAKMGVARQAEMVALVLRLR